jgi:hypothetical protein
MSPPHPWLFAILISLVMWALIIKAVMLITWG